MVHRVGPWPAGTPCWLDIMVGDLARSQAFYTAILGWDFTGPDEQLGGYCNAVIDGERVAGLSPTLPGLEAAPKVWSVYLATDDLAATHAAALELGAEAIVEPTAMAALGSMAMWLDPLGAAFGGWQAGEHTGFDLVNEVGAVAWCDLMTPDLPASKAFYAKLFGFSYQDVTGEPGVGRLPSGEYCIVTAPGGQAVGGMGASAPDDTGSAWSACFETEDVDAALRRVAAAGGSLLLEPREFESGRLAGVAGPDGEPFLLLTSSQG